MWWVPGGGGLAADGIKSEHTTFGVVVNLRDEHRPQLTVDRNTLRDWDSDWVTRQVSASLPNLMTWPGFTLSWLWAITSDNVAWAKRIFDYGVSVSQQIPANEDWAPDHRAALEAVGCLPLDRNVLLQKGLASEWLTAWRVGVWRSAGLSVEIETAAPRRMDGFPVPDPIDGMLLGNLSEDLYYSQPNTWEIVRSLVTLDDARAAAKETVRSQLRRMRKYAITGLNLSAARCIPPVDAKVNDTTGSLIYVLTAWSPPGEPPLLKLTAAVIHASERGGLPVGSLIRRAASLAPTGWSPPVLNLEHFRDGTFTDAEKIVLSRDADQVAPWLDGELLPGHLTAVCERLQLPMAQVLELCDRLALLGYTVPGRDAYPPELETIELQALQRVDRPGQVLSLLDLTLIAGQAETSVGAAHRSLARLEGLGMLVRPEFDDSIDFTPTRREHGLLINAQQGISGRYGSDRLSPAVPWLWVAEILFEKSRLGPDQEQLITLAEKLIPITSPARPLTAAELVAAARSTGRTLAGTSAALRAVYPEAQLPSLPPDCESLTVHWAVGRALLGSEVGALWGLSPGAIVQGALDSGLPLGDFLRVLNHFRALGAPVPPYDDTIRSVLNAVQIDEYDLNMLTDFSKSGAERYLKTYSALGLVIVAGRLGWTLDEAQQRLARLVPIGLELEYPVGIDFPDEIVHWYDLLALTAYFDGQSPVISGRIGEAYLEKAAEEIFDCAPEEISDKASLLRQRLAIYAPLFDFQLDALEEDTVA